MIARYSNRTGSRSFVLSNSDLVVLGRALVGESGQNSFEYPSILWTLARRFLWSRFAGSFIDLARAFCQPINPRWRRGGDLFEAARRRGHWSGSDKAADRRDAIAALQWDDLPATARAALLAFQAGNLPEQAATKKRKTTNWGSWPGIADRYPHGGALNNGRNWFFRDLSDRGVQIVRAAVDTVTSGGGAALAVILAAVALAVWGSR